MVFVIGPRFMRTVNRVAETSVGRDKLGELQGPRPIRWWYQGGVPEPCAWWSVGLAAPSTTWYGV